MQTEVVDGLFLELSQITKAKTQRELKLEKALRDADVFIESIRELADVKGHGADWNSIHSVASSIEEEHRQLLEAR